MAKAKRVSIPKAVSEAVMKEFRHKCAICGTDRPQLHHVDKDPSNSVVENLLPLCPNCHLLDQHDPTTPIDSRRLALFRKYKDPSILHSKFLPIWRRCEFLLNVLNVDEPQFQADSVELCEFIASFVKGKFYKRRIKRLLKPRPTGRIIPAGQVGNGPVLCTDRPELESYYPLQVFVDQSGRQLIFELIVELLRYQDWI